MTFDLPGSGASACHVGCRCRATEHGPWRRDDTQGKSR